MLSLVRCVVRICTHELCGKLDKVKWSVFISGLSAVLCGVGHDTNGDLKTHLVNWRENWLTGIMYLGIKLKRKHLSII